MLFDLNRRKLDDKIIQALALKLTPPHFLSAPTPFLGPTAQEGAPGSAAAFGVEDWTGLHFSPRMPNPLSRLHLDFIFSPFEIAQAVELYQCNSRCCAQQGV